MRRRDVLRLGAAALGASVVGRPVTAHPGPYGPYGSVDLRGATEAVVSADGSVAYVAASTGYATVDVSVPDRPRILADRRDLLADRDGGPLRGIHDAKVSGDRLLIAGPANPRPGALAGVLLVDVSDPADPTELTFFETGYPVHNCALAGGYAYLTDNADPSHPLVVLEVADDGMREVARWSLADHDDRWERVPKGLRPVHDVFVRDRRAYVALWDAGTWILDVSDPTTPAALGQAVARPFDELAATPAEKETRAAVEPPGNHHYAAVNEDGTLMAVSKESWAVDREAGTTGGPSGVELWDVADPAAPTLRSTIDPPPTADASFGGTWTTAHNLDLRGERLYTSWYQGGVKRHDVSDPANPRELTWWRDPERAKFWTAQLAVPGATEGYFVASSMGLDDVPAALYAFPDHAGTQADPPPLGDGNATGPEIVTPTSGTGSDSGSGSGTGGTGDTTPTSTPTSTPAPTSAAEGPGFGLLGGATAVGAGLAWRWWRVRTDEDASPPPADREEP